MLSGSHFYAALILINGLVVIGLHNGGPFGTARRQSLQREGASGGKQYWSNGYRERGVLPLGSGSRARYRPDPVAGCVCGDGDATGNLYLNGEVRSRRLHISR